MALSIIRSYLVEAVPAEQGDLSHHRLPPTGVGLETAHFSVGRFVLVIGCPRPELDAK
jgi:hypothetical protein